MNQLMPEILLSKTHMMGMKKKEKLVTQILMKVSTSDMTSKQSVKTLYALNSTEAGYTTGIRLDFIA